MGRAKVKNPKTTKITVWCTKEEKEKLELKAKMCGLKTGPFLRNLALEYPLKSMVDSYAIDQLIKTRADLGRLGGLFKLWLTKNSDTKLSLGNRTYESIDLLVDDIEAKEEELIRVAKILIESKM